MRAETVKPDTIFYSDDQLRSQVVRAVVHGLPSNETQTKLDEFVRKTVAEQKKLFTEAVIKALDVRCSEWEKLISKPRYI